MKPKPCRSQNPSKAKPGQARLGNGVVCITTRPRGRTLHQRQTLPPRIEGRDRLVAETTWAAVVDSELNTALDEVDSGTASTDSLFEQGANMGEISQQLVTDALSGSGSESVSGGNSASSGDSASTGGATADGATTGGTATTTATGGSGWSSELPDGVQFDSVSLP